MIKVHQQLTEHLMKSVLVFASLSLISACALAAEPAAAPAAACKAPVIPAESTDVKLGRLVVKDINQWRDCIVAQPTEENLRADAMVKEKEIAWRAATVNHFRREAALAKTSFGPSTNDGYGFSRMDQLEREQRSTVNANGQAAFLRDRVTNDVAER
jgi:hypothetical protein